MLHLDSSKLFERGFKIGAARAEVGALLNLQAMFAASLGLLKVPTSKPKPASTRSPRTPRAGKLPESLKEAVRTPIRDWEQPDLDNLIEAGEELLAKKAKAEKS